MEKIPQSLTNEISRLNKNIYFSELVSSVLVIENLSLDFYKYENIQNLFKIILLLVDKTESKIEIALFINKELKYKKEEEAYIYEKFAYIIYTLANKLRFITEKNLIVSFPSYFNKSLDPQLYLKQKYKIELENSSYLDDKKYLYALKINLGDTSILDEISKAFITDRNIVFDQLLFDKLMEKYFINQECKELKFYSYVTMGGSFDHVHIGHNILLNKAALITNTKLGIGITSDQMISKKCPEYIRQPYSYRSDRITKFMIEIGFFNREINQETELQIYKIEDTKGNAGQQETLEALVLSIETLQGGEIVNQGRLENNLKPVEFVIVDLLVESAEEITKLSNINSYEDFKNINVTKLSSSKIRNNFIFSEESKFNPTKEVIEELYSEFKMLFASIIHKDSTKVDIDVEVHSFYWFSLIRDYYSQQWRRYHSLNHIHDYLKKYNKYFTLIEEYDKEKTFSYINSALTIWFHDVIYTPSRTDNEERSIDIFNEFYDYIKKYDLDKFNQINQTTITNYIMGTKYHFKQDYTTDNMELNLILDIDISKMGDDEEETYLTNSNILYEFSHHFEPVVLLQKRIGFLKMTLEKPKLFRTNLFEHLNDKAKENNKRLIISDQEKLNKLLG